MTDRIRREIRVRGVVQGVGFRPYVHGLAIRLGLSGLVGNDEAGVRIEVEGDPTRVDRFVRSLWPDAPPLAVIESVEVRTLAPVGDSTFVIAPSAASGGRQALIPPDVATCADCLAELADPADRRYRYPFVNCTNCGPRFTIVRDVPYDRAATTMAGFAMCAACRREYEDPRDRRFHAEPVCCPDCGPSLRLSDAAGRELSGDVIVTVARLLRDGAVVAVKGLGGYHLAVRADHDDAVRTLRARKHREDRPFAVMVRDLEAAADLCDLSPGDSEALAAPQRPIVLCRRREGASVAPAVAPATRELGLMLPYTPLHHLLAAELAVPFVLTSGNRSDEPIAYRDDDARARLVGIADAFLWHDRPIHIRTDDSVVRVTRGSGRSVRRSRGFAPAPIGVAWTFSRPTLGCGAELKNTFCLAKDGHAFVSHHIGDLANAETLRAFTEGIAHYQRLFDVSPQVVAHDLHPEYLSTKYAVELAGVELVGVQHHHAHIAACLADNGEPGPVIGVAFDGVGYGTDGTLWGGEFLVADRHRFDRLGSLVTVSMPGGTTAIRQPWRMAAAYLAMVDQSSTDHPVARRHEQQWRAVQQLAATGRNAPQTSSAGRLFDAVAALLGVRDEVSYEGQAAIELEQLADPAEPGAYAAGILDGSPFRVATGDLIRAVLDDMAHGAPAPTVAARFHNGIAAVVLAACRRLRADTGIGAVALSGGVFQNELLTGRAAGRLEDDGFRVLTHRRVPTNDGGISLGQVTIATAALGTGAMQA